MSKLLVIVLVQIGATLALECYQGQQNNSVAVVGSAMTCPQNAMSCIKSVDNATGIATRACQQTTCAQLFQYANNGYQQTTTANTTTTACMPTSTGVMCCCTGDGCNAATGTQVSLNAIGLTLFGFFMAFVLKF